MTIPSSGNLGCSMWAGKARAVHHAAAPREPDPHGEPAI
jgi:hypothetical protein